MTAVISTPPVVGEYTIDPLGSDLSFTCRHLFGLGRVRGTFAVKAGVAVVADPLESSTAAVEIDAASFHTGVQSRDAAVRSPTYLDTERFPVMAFVSERLVSVDGAPVLEGAFTVRDVSRPVRLEIAEYSASIGEFTTQTSIRIDRREFGLSAGRGFTGRFLDVTARIRWVRQ